MLILVIPWNKGWIGNLFIIGCYCDWWTRVWTINKIKVVLATEKRNKLGFPIEVISDGEFEVEKMMGILWGKVVKDEWEMSYWDGERMMKKKRRNHWWTRSIDILFWVLYPCYTSVVSIILCYNFLDIACVTIVYLCPCPYFLVDGNMVEKNLSPIKFE